MSDFSHIDTLFSAEEESCLSLESMQDYAVGKLPAVQVHAAERHLLNCELCSLAYEGLAEANPAEISAGVSAITDAAWKRVAALEKRKRRGAFIWMSTAASILILIVAGYFVLDRPADPSLDGLAEQMLERSDEAGASTPTDVSSGEFAENGPPPAPAQEELVPDPMSKMEGLAKESTGKDSPYNSVKPNQQILASTYDAKAPGKSDFNGLEAPVLADADEEVTNYYGGGFLANDAIEPVPTDNNNNGVTYTSAPLPTVTATVTKDLEDKGYLSMDSTALGWNSSLGSVDIVTGGDIAVVKEVPIEANFQDDFDANVDELVEVEEEFFALEDVPTRSENQQSIVLEDIVDEKKGVYKNDDKTMSGGVVATEPELFENVTAGRSMDVSNSRPQKVKRQRSNRKGKFSNTTAPERDQAEQAPPVAANEFQKGMDAYRNKEFSQASEELRQAASETPDNLEAHLYAARSFLEIKQPTAALYHLDRILAAPGNSYLEDAKWFKSIALLQLGDQKGAKLLLQEVEVAGGKRSDTAKEVLDQF